MNKCTAELERFGCVKIGRMLIHFPYISCICDSVPSNLKDILIGFDFAELLRRQFDIIDLNNVFILTENSTHLIWLSMSLSVHNFKSLSGFTKNREMFIKGVFTYYVTPRV
jgi:hypothetical protein